MQSPFYAEDGVPEGSTADQAPIPEIADVETERETFAELIAFVTAHKDPGTVITHVSPDAFVADTDGEAPQEEIRS